MKKAMASKEESIPKRAGAGFSGEAKYQESSIMGYNANGGVWQKPFVGRVESVSTG